MCAREYDLDDRDTQIISLLQEDGRASLAKIGEAVELSPDAVRARLSRMTGDGVVRVVGVVEPRSLGYGALATVVIQYRGHLESLVRLLRGQPQITFLALTIGEYNATCEVAAIDDKALSEFIYGVLAQIEGVVRLESWRFLGVDKWEVQGRPPPPAARGPRLSRALDELDVKLLRALVESPRLKYSDLEKLVELPYSAVRRRTQALFDSGTIVATAVVDMVTAQPRIMAMLAMRWAGDATSSLAQIMKAEEVHILMHVGGRFNAIAEVGCRSPEHLGGFITWLASLPGIAGVESFIMTHFAILPMPWAIVTANTSENGSHNGHRPTLDRHLAVRD